MDFCKGVGPFDQEEQPTVVNVPPFDPNPPRRPEALQQPPQSQDPAPVPVWPTGVSPDVCNQQKDVGRCTGHFNRYYYDRDLGTCELFQEEQIGNERYNIFTGCPKGKTCTIILRGGAEQFIDESDRSLHDAIMIVRRAMKNDAVVAGGGAIEMEISKYLRDVARSIPGKEQLLISAFAKAFEIIPRQLCYNAGFDATDLLNKLRQKHAQGHKWFGIDIQSEDLADNMESCVWEPAIVKINAITAASEAACLILSVDETVKNPKAKANDETPGGRPF